MTNEIASTTAFRHPRGASRCAGLPLLFLCAALATSAPSRAQTLDTVCEVPAAECIVPEQPVGSVCFCGEAEGKIREQDDDR